MYKPITQYKIFTYDKRIISIYAIYRVLLGKIFQQFEKLKTLDHN